jgi:hypothetical protein
MKRLKKLFCLEKFKVQSSRFKENVGCALRTEMAGTEARPANLSMILRELKAHGRLFG